MPYGKRKTKLPPGRGYKGDNDECPHGCGLKYKNLRTGLTYWDVFASLMDYKSDPSEWKYKKRGTVLGAWFAIKQSMWQYHTEEGGCPMDPRNVAAEQQDYNIVAEGDAVEGSIEDEEEVPF